MDSTPSKTAKPSLWHRFIEWLSGPPNHEKLEMLKDKPWYVRFKLTFGTAVMIFICFVIPETVNTINGLPDWNSLDSLEVNIVATQNREPHLFVDLADGTRKTMEWPVHITPGKGGFKSYAWTDQEREALVGCVATIRGEQLRWTLTDRYRVWELACPKKKIWISREKTTEERLIQEKWPLARFAFIGALYFLNIFFFLRERRGNVTV